MHRYTNIVIIKLFTLALFLIFPNNHPPTPHPPPYQRQIRNYKKSDSKNVRKVVDLVNWERLFDQEDINIKVVAFNETILNVFRNYVPDKYIAVDDKDPV